MSVHPRLGVADKFMLLAVITILVMVQLSGCLREAGAQGRTANFVVRSNDGQSQLYAERAEQWYQRLAEDWLGQPLGPLPQPAAIDVVIDTTSGGGSTSMAYLPQGAEQFSGTWRGNSERMLDSVIPHEVFHIVSARRFGRPLPRWIDEGICMTVESSEAQGTQWKCLAQCLNSNRGLPFNQMLAATEYPADVMAFYAQSWSLTRFLLAHGGKPKLVAFAADTIDVGTPAALQKHYGYTVNELQPAWVSWVAKQQPEPDRNTWESGYRWNVSNGCWDNCSNGVCTQPPPPSFYLRPRQQPARQQPRVATTQPRAPASCQCEQRLVSIEARLAAIEARQPQPGERGEKGDKGDDGRSCDTAAVIAELKQTQPTAEQIAAALMESYGEQLRGPRGEQGLPGKDGTLPTIQPQAGNGATLPRGIFFDVVPRTNRRH